MKNHRLNFFEFAEPCIPSLYNTALKMTGNVNDANILVQNTFRKAVESSENLKKSDNFKVWLFKILMTAIFTTNQHFDFEINKHENNDELEDFYLFRKLDETINIQERTKEDILETFYEEDVKAALEKLPFQFRLMVLLCDVEGFSYDETAAILDTPLATVISRLYHGRKLFQQYLWYYIEERL